jgi:hypothetical protein
VNGAVNGTGMEVPRAHREHVCVGGSHGELHSQRGILKGQKTLSITAGYFRLHAGAETNRREVTMQGHAPHAQEQFDRSPDTHTCDFHPQTALW